MTPKCVFENGGLSLPGTRDFKETYMPSVKWVPCRKRLTTALLLLLGGCQTQGGGTAAALEGKVSSANEGVMEGVVVSARRDNSNMTISVISDDKGMYRFPVDRLQPGHYSLAIRAAGYDLGGQGGADVALGRTVQADLKLEPTKDLASQLSSAEWLLSVPGTQQQHESLMNCAECHTLQVPLTSTHNAADFKQLISRMLGTYAYQSQPGDVQLMPKPRHLDPAVVDRMAAYLASINLGEGAEYRYKLKTLPRVRGPGTHVIITEYDIPRPLAQPHDVIVDPSGTVWYQDFGKQILGRLDPKTGRTEEFPIPLVRPGRPTGTLAIENGQDGKIWVALHLQAGVALFDTRTKAFQLFPVPDSLMQPNTQTSQLAVGHESVDGKIWTSANADAATRLDVRTGKYESFFPFRELEQTASAARNESAPTAALGGGEGAGTRAKPKNGGSSMGTAGVHVIYGMATDSANNFYGMSFLGQSVIRVDAKTGKAQSYDTVTPFSQPRRGQMDSRDRLWFAQYNANRISMLATRSGAITDYIMKTPWTAPYDATLDKNGYAWTGGMNTDRIVRINIKTGEQIEYQMPRTLNLRRVFVDNNARKPVFWVGNNHAASIIKVEPTD